MGIHARISELEKQLDVVVVLQEEEGHFEPQYNECKGYYDRECLDDKLVVDKPAVTEPDIEKRIKARTELINLKHSLWSFQYLARERVEEILNRRKSSDEIELDLAFISINYHALNLKANKVVQEEVAHYSDKRRDACRNLGYDTAMLEPDEERVVIIPEVTEPDIEERVKAKRRLEEIYHTTKYVIAKRKIEGVLGYAPGEKQEDERR